MREEANLLFLLSLYLDIQIYYLRVYLLPSLYLNSITYTFITVNTFHIILPNLHRKIPL